MAWGVNREKAAERQQEIEQRDQRGGKIRWYKWVTGQPPGNRLRFLPPGPDENKPPYIPDAEFAMVVYAHKRIPGIDKDANFRCIGKTYPDRGPCPRHVCMCAVMNELRDWIGQNKDREDRILGTGQNKYYLSRQYWTNCLNRRSNKFIDSAQNNEVVEVDLGRQQLTYTQTPAPELIALPETVYKWALTNLDVVGDFTNPDSGMDAYIVRTGAGRDTKYPTMTIIPDRMPLDPDPTRQQAILNSMYNVAEIFKYPDAATLDKMVAHVNTVQQFIGRTVVDVPAMEAQQANAQTAPGAGYAMGGGHPQTAAAPPAGQTWVPPPTVPPPAAQPQQYAPPPPPSTTVAPPAAIVHQPAQSPAVVPPPVTNGAADTKTMIAGMLQMQLNGEEPSCYFHQVIGHKKCQLCPWEAPCMDATQKAEGIVLPNGAKVVTLESRKAIHGIA